MKKIAIIPFIIFMGICYFLCAQQQETYVFANWCLSMKGIYALFGTTISIMATFTIIKYNSYENI